MDEKSNNQMELFDFFEGSDTNSANTENEDMFPEEMEDLDFNEENDVVNQGTEDPLHAVPPKEDSALIDDDPSLIPSPSISPGMPVFEYAGASEPIKNLQLTFDDLRKEKSKDFPELEKKEKVSWTVDYGIIKAVSDPSKTIGQLKTEIESSKEFLDALKKSKKPVTCKVKPRVSGQTKGIVSAYKGVFTNLDDASKSKKIISIVPSRDGRVYEIRNTEIGLFVTRTKEVEELDSIVPCFRMRLPKIPKDMLQQIVTFFRSFIQKGRIVEAMVNLLWDRLDEKYFIHIPEQVVSKTTVNALPYELDDARFLHVADIHSHNTMSAKFSSTDNEDEKATRLYIVIGKLDRYFPEISIRISNGGKFHEIHPSDVLEGVNVCYPSEWHSKVTIARNSLPEDAESFKESGAA